MHPRIGTAGWSIPGALAADFASAGSHLARYARVFRCVEINSSFYRPHRVETYARWASSTPADFRFAVKLPRAITHLARLRGVEDAVGAFLEQVAGLGEKLGPLLMQLPPSFAYEEQVVGKFFELLRKRFEGADRPANRDHPSWFTSAAEAVLVRGRVARAAVDPAVVPAAAQPAGWLGRFPDGRDAVLYYRWHGSPKMYWSRYDADWLQDRARDLAQRAEAAQCWCVFDNTAAAGTCAAVNAMEL